MGDGPRKREREGKRSEGVEKGATGTTNQIFAPRLHGEGSLCPLLLFICKARLNYGGRKPHGGRPIVLLADQKHHCTTTGRESGYLLLFKCISVPRRSAPPRPPPPWTAKFLRPPNIIQRTRSPSQLRIVTKLGDFCERRRTG